MALDNLTYADSNPYNVESPQTVYYEYSKDIGWNYEDPLPSWDDTRFVWETQFRPYVKVLNTYEHYHLWMRFKIGKTGQWSTPIRFIYSELGKSGIDGADGVDGKDGRNGIQGPRGLQGLQGIQGIKGDKGDKGDQGLPGIGTGGVGLPAGGLDGQYLSKLGGTDYSVEWRTLTSGWLSGSGVPNPVSGKITDWYIDEATGDFYEKTGVATWTYVSTFKGTQGIQGIQGIQGVAGVSGIDFKGDWVTGTTYVASDVVRSPSNGNAYYCQVGLVSNTDPGTLPYPDTNWSLFVMQGAPGPQGVQGVQGLQGIPGVSWAPSGGNTDDVMVKGAVSYVWQARSFVYSPLVSALGTITGGTMIGLDVDQFTTLTDPRGVQKSFEEVDAWITANKVEAGTITPSTGWSGTIKYEKRGNQVMLSVNVEAYSSATSLICPLPANIRPVAGVVNPFIAIVADSITNLPIGNNDMGYVASSGVRTTRLIDISHAFADRYNFTITYLL